MYFIQKILCFKVVVPNLRALNYIGEGHGRAEMILGENIYIHTRHCSSSLSKLILIHTCITDFQI